MLGIQYITLISSTAENWLRPKSEVRSLMSLLKKYIAMETPRLMRNNIRFNVIGNLDELPPDVNKAVEVAIAKTSNNSGMILTLALSYGARQEILQAVTKLADDVATGKITKDELTESYFTRYLYTADLPDPDFLIRTSG